MCFGRWAAQAAHRATFGKGQSPCEATIAHNAKSSKMSPGAISRSVPRRSPSSLLANGCKPSSVSRAGLFVATAVACVLHHDMVAIRITRRANDQVIYAHPVWKVDVSSDVAKKQRRARLRPARGVVVSGERAPVQLMAEGIATAAAAGAPAGGSEQPGWPK